VAAGVGGGRTAKGHEAAAVPVGALPVAAFHSPAAETAADAAAQRVDASGAAEAPRG
jgi:hypothetical protein